MTKKRVLAKPRLKEVYEREVVPELKKRHNLSSHLSVPRLVKIVVSLCIGREASDKSTLDSAIEDMRKITGQAPVITRARKSIAGFKIRQGDILGIKSTLRGRRMYDFLDKFINIVIPSFKDFSGLKLSSFDGGGNYNIGLKEQIVFPEIDYDTLGKIRGLQVTIETSAKDDGAARELLTMLGMPFEKTEQNIKKNK